MEKLNLTIYSELWKSEGTSRNTIDYLWFLASGKKLVLERLHSQEFFCRYTWILFLRNRGLIILKFFESIAYKLSR